MAEPGLTAHILLYCPEAPLLFSYKLILMLEEAWFV